MSDLKLIAVALAILPVLYFVVFFVMSLDTTVAAVANGLKGVF